MRAPSFRKLGLVSAVALVLAGGIALVRSDADVAPEGDPSQIDARLWVEKRPEKLTDYVHAAVFLTQAHFGIFERASAYDLRLEQFDLNRDKGTAKVFFPQTSRSSTFTFAVKECSEKPPFDLCLDVSQNPWGGPKRYYGFSREEDERAALGAFGATLRERALSASRP